MQHDYSEFPVLMRSLNLPGENQTEKHHLKIIYDGTTNEYALTQSGLDLIVRGAMRSLSKDPKECHSCLKAYDNVYFTVLSLEQIYYMW